MVLKVFKNHVKSFFAKLYIVKMTYVKVILNNENVIIRNQKLRHFIDGRIIESLAWKINFILSNIFSTKKTHILVYINK